MEKSIKRSEIIKETKYIFFCPYCNYENETIDNISLDKVLYCENCSQTIEIEN